MIFVFTKNYLSELERACGSFRKHERVAVWLPRNFMFAPVLSGVYTRLTLFSNDGNRHESTTTLYTEVLNHLLRSNASNAVVVKPKNEIGSFKQNSSTPWNVSEKLRDLNSLCSGVYHKQIFEIYFFENIDFTFCCILRFWLADKYSKLSKTSRIKTI